MLGLWAAEPSTSSQSSPASSRYRSRSSFIWPSQALGGRPLAYDRTKAGAILTPPPTPPPAKSEMERGRAGAEWGSDGPRRVSSIPQHPSQGLDQRRVLL